MIDERMLTCFVVLICLLLSMQASAALNRLGSSRSTSENRSKEVIQGSKPGSFLQRLSSRRISRSSNQEFSREIKSPSTSSSSSSSDSPAQTPKTTLRALLRKERSQELLHDANVSEFYRDRNILHSYLTVEKSAPLRLIDKTHSLVKKLTGRKKGESYQGNVRLLPKWVESRSEKAQYANQLRRGAKAWHENADRLNRAAIQVAHSTSDDDMFSHDAGSRKLV